jgi:GAF domain-containing protein
MVDQIAIALQNANLINELQNRFNEIATLNHISQAVAAQTDLQTLLDKVREEIARIAKVANVYFALYDEQSQTFEIPYMFEEGRVYTVSPTPLGRGLTGFIITNRKPLLINREEDALKLGAMVGGQSGMAQSYLGVPMMIGEKVIGVLAIQDLKEPGRFGESQTRFLETISAEIAIAVQNTRLFEQTKRRADELAAINRVASAANTALDVPTIAKAVVGEIASIFKANHSQIALLDSSGNSLTVVAAFPAEVPGGIHLPIILADNFAVQEVFQTAKTLVVNDAPINPLTPPMYETTVQAFMITPLVMRGEVIGIIEIDSDLPSKEFTSDEIALAETLASQIANTIENSRLYQQVRRRAEHLLAAAEVSRVATSITNPDELVVKSVELIRERFKLYYVALFLVDSAGQWAELKHATGEAGQELLRRQHRLEIGGRSMVGSAIAERQARIAPDAEMESVRFANPLLPDTRSEIALPLTVGGNVMGALDAQSVEYNAFSEADIVVLQTMAEQLATAIQNARLIVETEKALTETRRLAHRERVIADVTQKITAGPDIKNVLQAAIEELRRSTNSDRAVVRLTIPTTEDGG